jgi:hypothetical protein
LLPFTADQFHALFARYNEAIAPAPLAAYALGALAVALVFWPHRRAGIAIAAMLAAMWLWTGVAYHGLFFSAINPLATVFAALFVAQAALLLAYGPRLRFAAAWNARGALALLLILYAALLYPLIGIAAGYPAAALPMFGVTPCPVTIFTFGLLLHAPAAPWPLFAIPLFWSLIGGSAAVLLAVPQDWALLLSGPLAVALLWNEHRARA